ncbi:putative membrane protein (TIGR02226 family) [Gramella sp. Hel_I_59]|uniref:BatA domain-containing protein n=1 Tax=Gramella sp. Hel_I_59 TaxID=1249978 RepID=UPI001150EDAE|nr:BatA domain-containing protein [Gramella sp. Hel_I_59]TQI70916.1 putative membrane protein (TIGR02226 family) [Gramella sp. Hel_I_59]
MQFEHPELLYALSLLIIPILVHLFKLRRFQKEDFTNVKFLKRVVQQTRKSSQLKKFLVLFSRLSVLGFLILAFAKPYFPAESEISTKNLIIYLDNSYSMQLKNQGDELLEIARNEVLENLAASSVYSLITNDGLYTKKSGEELKVILQKINYTSRQLDLNSVLLKTQQLRKIDSSNLVLISDFQEAFLSQIEIPENNIISIKLKPENIQNLQIDTLYLTNSKAGILDIEVQLSGNSQKDGLVISMYDGAQLLSRKTIDADNSDIKTTFSIPSQNISNGRVVIDDEGLKYDNIIYFSISEQTPISVLAISEGDSNYLQGLYTEPEFNLKVSEANEVEYTDIQQASLIVLNELSELNAANLNNIKQRSNEGSSVLFIPNSKNRNEFIRFSGKFQLGFKPEWIEGEKLITTINFGHPLLENVFQKKIQNFEYPRVNGYFSNISGNSILSFQNNDPFLISKSNIYIFTAPLNEQISNFQNSPLIVPVLYQIGLQSLPPAQLYYQTSELEEISIQANIEQDHVLHLTMDNLDFIPQQQRFADRVSMSVDSEELDAGNYEIKSQDKTLANLSFNEPRNESELQYLDLEIFSIQNHESIAEYFSEVKAGNESSSLWKWFIIFAIIFLVIEMLLLKLLK